MNQEKLQELEAHIHSLEVQLDEANQELASLKEAENQEAVLPMFNYSLTEDGTGIRIDEYIGFYEEENLTIPSEVGSLPVKEIGKNVFKDCQFLKTVRLPSELELIGESAFQDCRSLKTVIFRGTCRIIQINAFRNCTALTEIHFPEQLENIGDYAFAGTALNKIYFPKNLKHIKKGVFMHCNQLKAVQLPEGLETIGAYAFSDDNRGLYDDLSRNNHVYACVDQAYLDKIYIPASVTEIDKTAFGSKYYRAKYATEGTIIPLCGTIYCHEGSYAEQFAKENHLKVRIYRKNPAGE